MVIEKFNIYLFEWQFVGNFLILFGKNTIFNYIIQTDNFYLVIDFVDDMRYFIINFQHRA